MSGTDRCDFAPMNAVIKVRFVKVLKCSRDTTDR